MFENWENETFEVFDRMKNKEGIAIDLGAWIGTTSIWLSKHFYHVLSVEADKESLKCLDTNLKASDCLNVTICPKAIAEKCQKVIFGTLSRTLNESMSCIKEISNLESDYFTESISFKQLLSEYILANETLNSHKITFIKCDIEGGEENILEDLLNFAYNNGVTLWISFHLDWWKHKQIDEFEGLFKQFKIESPQEDVCDYIRGHPFTTLLFQPLR